MASLGFEITRVGRFGNTARGPAKLVTDVLGVKLAIHALPRRDSMRATLNFASDFAPPRPQDLYVAPTQSLTVKTDLSPHIDDFVFVPPPTFFAAPSADPPDHSWHSLDEAKIRKFLKVPPGASGAGVKVAIIDTGTFLHPYYSTRGLDLTPTPGADEVGHGTAIPFNTFAVASKASVIGIQHTDPPQNAMEDAADAGVDIISCSWGWDYEQSFPILEATIRDIVNDGHIVLFAAGNGHQPWPSSMPDVLAIGGVYADPGGNLEASSYASGYLYPGRKVPDVSGLCGMQPKGIYIVPPPRTL
jgi:serine protease AprX